MISDDEHAELSRLHAHSVGFWEPQLHALRAENERLKGALTVQGDPDGCARCEALMDGNVAATSDICHDCWNHLEDKLAAANALLVRWQDRAEGEDGLTDATEAHLAGQPAAPAPCQDCDRWRTGTKNPHNLYKDDLPAGFIVDAVDAIELCHAMNGAATPVFDVRGRTMTVCSELANEVLKALDAVPTTELRTYAAVPFPGAPSPRLRKACVAELTRRDKEG